MHVNVIFSKASAVILFLLPALLSILLAKCFESSLCPLGFVFQPIDLFFVFRIKGSSRSLLTHVARGRRRRF